MVGGTDSFFFSSIVDKLLKEKCKLFHIAGAKKRADSVNRRVVTYNIDVDDEYVHFVVQSVKPEVIIYLGAFDDRYAWKDYHRTSAKYMCELTNILVAASDLGVKKFIYLSTINVYGFKNEGIVTEETPLAPSNVKSIIVAQGERLCKDFADGNKINAITLRFGLVYGDLQFQSVEDDYIIQKCLGALIDRNITINNQIFPTIYVNDAAIAVYKVVALEGDSGAYNVCDDATVNDAEICDIILTEYKDFEITLHGDESFTPQEYTVDGTKFKTQYSFFQKTSYVDGITTVAKYVKQNHYKINKTKEKAELVNVDKQNAWYYIKQIIGKMTSFFETIFVFALFVLIDYAFNANLYLEGMDFMLIFVVVVSITFGKQQALVAIMLSILYYLVDTFISGGDLLLIVTSGNFLVRILFLFIVGILVGHTRDRLHQKIDDSADRIEYLEGEYKKLDEINDVTVAVKQELEERMLTYTDSLATNYSIIERMDSLISSKVYVKAMEVMGVILKSKNICIYTRDESGYNFNLDFWTSDDAKGLGATIDLKEIPEMNESFLNSALYANKKLLPEMPLLAAPIYNNGNIDAIAMIWDLKFEALTMYHINLFTTLVKIITRSVTKAEHYKKSLENRFAADHPELAAKGIFMLSEDEYVEAIQIACEGEKAYNIPFSCLSINTENITFNKALEIIKPILTNMYYFYHHENRLEVLINGLPSNEAYDFLNLPEIIARPESKNIQLLTLVEEEVAS